MTKLLMAATRMTATRVIFGMFLLVSGLALGSHEATARDKKANYGRLEISTSPESYPLLIDGIQMERQQVNVSPAWLTCPLAGTASKFNSQAVCAGFANSMYSAGRGSASF